MLLCCRQVASELITVMEGVMPVRLREQYKSISISWPRCDDPLAILSPSHIGRISKLEIDLAIVGSQHNLIKRLIGALLNLKSVEYKRNSPWYDFLCDAASDIEHSRGWVKEGPSRVLDILISSDIGKQYTEEVEGDYMSKELELVRPDVTFRATLLGCRVESSRALPQHPQVSPIYVLVSFASRHGSTMLIAMQELRWRLKPEGRWKLPIRPTKEFEHLKASVEAGQQTWKGLKCEHCHDLEYCY